VHNERGQRDSITRPETKTSDRELRKDLTFQQLFFISFGGMVGSGWLFAVLAANAVAGPAVVVSWVLAAILVIFVALNWAEIASMIPRSGAIVRYPYLTHGGYLGLVVAWSYLLASVVTPPIEALAVLQYLSGYVEGLTGVKTTTVVDQTTILTGPGMLAAVTLMTFFFLVNMFGVRFFARFNQWITWWKLIIPFVTFLLLFSTFQGSNFVSYGGFAPLGLGSVFNAIAVSGIVFAYLGFLAGLNHGGEARNPQRDIFRATVYSVVVAAVMYLLLQVAFTGALDWASLGLTPGDWAGLRGSNWANQPLYSALESSGLALLGAFGVLLLIDAAVSPAGTGWIYMGQTSRTIYGMAMQGDLPRPLQRVGERFRVPWLALVASLVVGCFFFLPFPSWYRILGFVTAATVYSLVMGAVMLRVMRRTAPDLPRPFRLRGTALLCPLGFLAGSLIFYWTGFEVMTAVLAAILLGLPLYVLFQAPRRGLMARSTGLALGVSFLAAWFVIQYLGPLGKDALPFLPFWAFVVVEVSAFTGLVWSLGGAEVKREVNSAWWMLFLTLALYLLSYYGSYGPLGEPLATFPWDSAIATAVGLVAYYWGVASGYQTEAMREVMKVGTGPTPGAT
jgi:amino acid transporter